MFGPVSTTVTLTTSAPPRAVWSAFSTVARWPEVLTDLASVQVEPDGNLVPGATVRTVALPDRNVIDMRYDVVAVEPGQSLALRSSAEGFSAQTSYRFDPGGGAEHPDGTTVSATALVAPEWLRRRIVATLWRPKLIEQIQMSLRRRTSALIELAEKIDSETRTLA